MAKGRSARKEKKKPKKKKEKSVTWNDVSKNLDSAQKQWIKRWK
jgi:hypothetical protein